MPVITDKVTLKRKISRRGEKQYDYYFISFSTKYTPTLSKYKELYNVMLVTPDGNKIVLPKVSLYVYSHQYVNGNKIPQYSITIPKMLAEELWEKGLRKLKVVVLLPDLVKQV